jgi:hypothetical protein
MTGKRNAAATHSFIKKTHNFVASAYGAYRLTQLPGKTLALGGEIAHLAGSPEIAKPMKDTAKVFNTAASGMIIAYWIWDSFELKDQIAEVAEKGFGDGRLLELFRVSLDWATAGCYSVGNFVSGTAKSSLGTVASVTDLSVDSIEAYQAAKNWVRADHLLANNPEFSEKLQGDLKAERTLQFISGMKSSVAVAAGVLGLLGAILAATLVPPVVFLTMGLMTCVLSIIKHYYKADMESVPLSKWEFKPLVSPAPLLSAAV